MFSTSQMAGDNPATHPEPDARQERRDLYRYVTADNAEEYIAIMRLFSSTLLADLSAGEAQTALERSGVVISAEVRPRSDEAALLAEGDPWWQLAEKPTQALINAKRTETLAQSGMREYFVDNAIPTMVLAEFLSSTGDYALLAGLQPDLYRAFMVRTWRSSARTGAVGLIHPESHFTEKKAAHLRAETYRRLRRHWVFRNKKKIFAELTDQLEFGVHVYSASQAEPRFLMAASLYQPDTAQRSLTHDGSGEPPALKTIDGEWDTRPHAQRIILVDSAVLAVWADILDEPGTPVTQARMVYPVNRESSRVLEKLSKAPRAHALGLEYSSGWHETSDRKKGYFEVRPGIPSGWSEVVLQGPHFSVGNPLSKQPREVVRSNNDWDEIDLEGICEAFVPRTEYKLSAPNTDVDSQFGYWPSGRGSSWPVRSHFRLAISEYVGSVTGHRTLQPAILAPGVTHVHSVNSYGSPADDQNWSLVALAGVCSSIPLDFLTKLRGSGHIPRDAFESLPFPRNARLEKLIVERTMRLNCVLPAYEPLWLAIMGVPWIRSEMALIARHRRLALLEIDALCALLLGITVDELCSIYRTQFPVLRGYEQNDLYDANGRKVPGEMNRLYRKVGETLTLDERTWTHPQSGVEYLFEFPFRSFDREEDMRKAHAHFSSLLEERS